MTLDFGIDVSTLPSEVKEKLAELELELSEGMTHSLFVYHFIVITADNCHHISSINRFLMKYNAK